MEVITTYSDAELLGILQTGADINPALRYLYRQHFSGLCHYIEQNHGNREDAEDIFQEVLVSFIELVRLNKFRGEASIKTFLYALNRNNWLNELKKRNRSQLRELKYENLKDNIEPGMEDIISGREARKQVFELVDRLGAVCKKILLAFYYEKLSMKEILEQSDYENEQVVRNKKYKCLKQLEQWLTEDDQLAQKIKQVLHYEQ